ncbi:NTP transferase domain-containing protein [Komagataeibacter swingsii]|uniref:Molybdenum cofactor guanylyltransferase n=2 Tax=Komagataeibacter swingsii TaxID=215220 RepID=A0A850P881_9PROT|nr:NTP transferase domain-containing protein [Komagataeibacter swingsii]
MPDGTWYAPPEQYLVPPAHAGDGAGYGPVPPHAMRGPVMSRRVAGLVMAGGMARRMGGGDKPLLRLGDATCLQRIVDRLCPCCVAMAVSANGDPARFAACGLPVLPDAIAGVGPLAGVLAGLEWAAGQGCDVLVTVPGDTPFIPHDLVPRLLPAPSFAASGGQRHSLVAAWPVGSRALLARQLDGVTPETRRELTRVRTLADALGARGVDFAVPPGGPDPFMNINTPADYAVARRHAGD